MIAAVVICAILVGAAAIHWGVEWYRTQQEIKARQAQADIMAYVEKKTGAEFDFTSAAEQLGLSHDYLAEQLGDLMQARRIRVTSRPVWRKPILISLHDKQMFFWIVTAVTDEEKAGGPAKFPIGELDQD